MSADTPRGVIVVRGDDIGVIGAVTVEVDGEPVACLYPSDVQRSFRSLMGRTSTTLTFGDGEVRWVEEGPARPPKSRCTCLAGRGTNPGCQVCP